MSNDDDKDFKTITDHSIMKAEEATRIANLIDEFKDFAVNQTLLVDSHLNGADRMLVLLSRFLMLKKK